MSESEHFGCDYDKCLVCPHEECVTGQVARELGQDAYNEFNASFDMSGDNRVLKRSQLFTVQFYAKILRLVFLRLNRLYGKLIEAHRFESGPYPDSVEDVGGIVNLLFWASIKLEKLGK